MNPERRFEKNLLRLGFGRASSALVALSGGGDSVALTVLAAAQGAKYGNRIHAARVSHGIRPEKEDLEERRLCRDLCSRFEIPYRDLVLETGKVAERQQKFGCGVEQAARTLRYAALEDYRREIAVDFLFLGHTADDQFETILMRLFGASGPEGLKGISECRESLMRPLLRESRTALREYLDTKGVIWAEDSSNASADYRRNRVRNEVIPVISDVFPGWERSLAVLAERSREAADALNSSRRTAMPFTKNAGEIRWRIGDWESSPDYVKVQALWDLVAELGETDIPDRRVPWSAVTDGRRHLDDKHRWSGYGIEIDRVGEEFRARKNADIPGFGRVVLGPKDVETRFQDVLGNWIIDVGRDFMPKSAAYSLSPNEWPIVVYFTDQDHTVNIDVQGRRSRITEKSSRKGSGDADNEMIYIRIRKREEG